MKKKGGVAISCGHLLPSMCRAQTLHREKPRRRLCEFAPHPGKPYSSSRSANFLQEEAPAARGSCASLQKALFLPSRAQTFHPERAAVDGEFAPHPPESLILPSRGANTFARKAAGGCGRCAPLGKALFLRREAQTLHRKSRRRLRARPLWKPYSSLRGANLYTGRKTATRLREFAPPPWKALFLRRRGANFAGKSRRRRRFCASIPESLILPSRRKPSTGKALAAV